MPPSENADKTLQLRKTVTIHEDAKADSAKPAAGFWSSWFGGGSAAASKQSKDLEAADDTVVMNTAAGDEINDGQKKAFMSKVGPRRSMNFDDMNALNAT